MRRDTYRTRYEIHAELVAPHRVLPIRVPRYNGIRYRSVLAGPAFQFSKMLPSHLSLLTRVRAEPVNLFGRGRSFTLPMTAK